MTVPAEPLRSPVGATDPSRLGLRARIWIGALAGTLVAAAGVAWLVYDASAPLETADPALLQERLLVVGAASLVVALLMAIWLDRGIVGRVRRFTRSARAQDAAPLHEPSASSGWGELADLRNHLTGLIMAYRHASRSEDQLQTLDRELETVRDAVRHWIETERWSALPSAGGAMHKLSDSLNRGMLRHSEVQDQNLEAVRQVGADLEAAVADARTAAEQAEGGFVEATALLTTVRELERLGADLQRALTSRAAAASTPLQPADALADVRAAITPLAASATVVQEIADQVHVLGNRATLIALHAVLAGRPGDQAAEPASPDDMKTLAREAREATDRVQALARDLGGRLRAANDRIAALGAAPEQPRAEIPHALTPDVLRAIERVREMIQDATRKSERLSAAGERTSRAADRLVRRLEEEIRDLEGLRVRLAPPAERSAPSTRPSASDRTFGVIEMTRPHDADDRSDRSEERP